LSYELGATKSPSYAFWSTAIGFFLYQSLAPFHTAAKAAHSQINNRFIIFELRNNAMEIGGTGEWRS